METIGRFDKVRIIKTNQEGVAVSFLRVRGRLGAIVIADGVHEAFPLSELEKISPATAPTGPRRDPFANF